MLQAEKCLQKHSSGHHSGFKGTLFVTKTVVWNPCSIQSIKRHLLRKSSRKSSQEHSRSSSRSPSSWNIDLYRTQEIKPKSGFLWHKAKDYLKRSISQWDKSKCRCKDTMQKRLNHKEAIKTFKGALRKMKCFCAQNLPLSLFDYQQREEFWGPRLRHLLVCFQRRYFYVCSRSKPKAL